MSDSVTTTTDLNTRALTAQIEKMSSRKADTVTTINHCQGCGCTCDGDSCYKCGSTRTGDVFAEYERKIAQLEERNGDLRHAFERGKKQWKIALNMKNNEICLLKEEAQEMRSAAGTLDLYQAGRKVGSITNIKLD